MAAMDKQEMIEGLLNAHKITTEDAMRLAEDNERDVAREWDHHMQPTEMPIGVPARERNIEREIVLEIKQAIDARQDAITEATPFHYESCLLEIAGEGLIIETEGGTYLSITVTELPI